MTTVDWIIVAFAALLAVYGFRQGFIVGALSFAGFALGAFAGTRLAPLLLGQGARSPYAPALGLMGALLAGGVLASGFEGVGVRVRRVLTLPLLGTLDGLLGAALSAAVGLGIVWVVGVVALQAPGMRNLRTDIQRSVILSQLNALLPPSGAILNALARLDPLPSVSGSAPAVAPPRSAIARATRVRVAGASVLRVLGTACGLGVEGTGWVAARGIVVTNAHVVAGEQDTTVQVGGRPPNLAAQAIAFDPRNDIAILRVDGLDRPALPLAQAPPPGRAAAILGYPKDGPFDVRPGRIGQTRTIVSQDAYGQGPVQRVVTPLRGLVRPGNSGGPMVDARGRVVTTVFAAVDRLKSRGPHAGFGIPNTVVSRELAAAGGPVGTGPCAR